MDTKLAHKAVKAARLAIGEERLSHDDTACSQGRIAGELAAKAGMTLAELDTESGGMSGLAAYAWSSAVDGWYDAQPKDVTESEYEQLLHEVTQWDGSLTSQDIRDRVVRMWSELKRRRGL